MRKNYILLVISFVLIILLCGIQERPVYAANTVPLDAKHFPDAYFRKYLKERYASGESTLDVSTVTELNVSGYQEIYFNGVRVQ